MNVQAISINDIKINSEWVRQNGDISDLIESMDSIGLVNPLILNTQRELLCGGRRLAAAKALGWSEVNCIVYHLEDLESELCAVEDNIVRKDFEGPQLARALDRRKELYQAKYPDSVQHRAGAAVRAGGEKVDSFATDMSRKMSVDEKTINRMVARSRESHPEIMKMWENKEISPSKIDKIIQLPQNLQVAVAEFSKKMDVSDLDFYVNDIKNRGYDIATMTIKKDKGATSAYKKLIKNSDSLRKAIHACTRFQFEGELHGYLNLRESLQRTILELDKVIEDIPETKETSQLVGKDAASEQTTVLDDQEAYLNTFEDQEETQEEIEEEEFYDPTQEQAGIDDLFREQHA